MMMCNKSRVIGMAALAFGLAAGSLDAGTLYFQSNFEDPVKIGYRQPGNSSWAWDLTGEDGTLSSQDNWQKSLERLSNSNLGINGSSIGSAYINVINSLTKNKPSLVASPTYAQNRVMKYEVFDISESRTDERESKGRVQMEMNDNIKWKEFYYEVNMYIPSSTINPIVNVMTDTWGNNRAFFLVNEMSNDNYTTTDSSTKRKSTVFLRLKRENQGDPMRWGLTARDTATANVEDWRIMWVRDNPNADVPVNKWFKLEFYLKEGGNAGTTGAGRVYVAMTVDNVKTVLFNITGPTRAVNPNNSMAGYSGVSPMKLYVNSRIIKAVNSDPDNNPNPVSLYWDKFRLYYGAPSDLTGTPTYADGKSGTIGSVPWVSSGYYLETANGRKVTGEEDYR